MSKLVNQTEAPSIIFLHGWAAHSGFFEQVNCQLQGASIYTPDLPGHGENKISENVVGEATIESAATWLKAFIESKCIQRPVLIGWSMGALVALEYIRQYGDDIAGLAIVDMTPKVLNNDEWSLGMIGGLNEERNQKSFDYISGNWEKYAKGMLPVFFAENESLPDCVGWVEQELYNNDGEVLAHYWNSMTEKDYRDLLSKITCPALVISGGKSQLYSLSTAKYLVEHIENSQLEVFDKSGHSPHLEESQKFSEVVLDFTKRL